VRVSEHFGLAETQPTLEFLDVDIRKDTKAFVDPHALRYLESDWGQRCVSLLQSFFTEVVECMRDGRDSRAQYLLSSLSEPNETHLGLSRGTSAGRGMGHGLAQDIWESLRTSKAISTGLLEDLEDTALFVPGVGHDRVSDITINIIREPLIEFTQDVAKYYGIPLAADVQSGRIWKPQSKSWNAILTELPMTPAGRLILVPKSIVRQRGTFDPGEYYNHYILPYLQDEEILHQTSLVRTVRGMARVTKKAVREKYGSGKSVNLDVTLKDPAILDRYRAVKDRRQEPPSHGDIANMTETEEPDWDALLKAVLDVEPGREGADEYHRAIQALLTTLFYPALNFPVREFAIHAGRKRIDINYTNVATHGFFHWLHAVHGVACAQIPVECKNYSKALKNPEFDQLSGRFGTQRGWVGFLCHRGYDDKLKVVSRARDAAGDNRGFVLALDDDDLRQLVELRKLAGPNSGTDFEYLLRMFQRLI
jgi:hypothetical protein